MPKSPTRAIVEDLAPFPRTRLARRGGGADRPRGARRPGAGMLPTATRSGWERSTATASPSRSSSRCSGNTVRASSCRGPASSGRTAEPASRSTAGAQSARRRAKAVPHAQSAAGPLRRRPEHDLWLDGRRRASRSSSRQIFTRMSVSAWTWARRSTRRAGGSGEPGASDAAELGVENRFDPDVIERARAGRPSISRCSSPPMPTAWAMPARSCGGRTGGCSARPIRARDGAAVAV